MTCDRDSEASIRVEPEVRATLKPADAEEVSSLAKSELAMSTSDTFKGVDDVRPSVAGRKPFGYAKVPRYLMSGSDVVIKLTDLGSIPSFQFFLVSCSTQFNLTLYRSTI